MLRSPVVAVTERAPPVEMELRSSPPTFFTNRPPVPLLAVRLETFSPSAVPLLPMALLLPVWSVSFCATSVREPAVMVEDPFSAVMLPAVALLPPAVRLTVLEAPVFIVPMAIAPAALKVKSRPVLSVSVVKVVVVPLSATLQLRLVAVRLIVPEEEPPDVDALRSMDSLARSCVLATLKVPGVFSVRSEVATLSVAPVSAMAPLAADSRTLPPLARLPLLPRILPL